MDNINKLEDKDEEDGGLSSKLPLSPDGKYLVLTTPDEEMMAELDREMGELEVKPPSPKVKDVLIYTCQNFILFWKGNTSY